MSYQFDRIMAGSQLYLQGIDGKLIHFVFSSVMTPKHVVDGRLGMRDRRKAEWAVGVVGMSLRDSISARRLSWQW